MTGDKNVYMIPFRERVALRILLNIAKWFLTDVEQKKEIDKIIIDILVAKQTPEGMETW